MSLGLVVSCVRAPDRDAWDRVLDALRGEGWSARFDGERMTTHGAEVLVHVGTRGVELSLSGRSDDALSFFTTVARHLADELDGGIDDGSGGPTEREDPPTVVVGARATDQAAWKAIAAGLRADGWDTWFTDGVPSPDARWVGLVAAGHQVMIERTTAGELVVRGSSAYARAVATQLARTLGGRIEEVDDEPDPDDGEAPIAIDWSRLPRTFTIVIRCDRAVSRDQLDALAREHAPGCTIAFERPSRGSDYARVVFDGPDGLGEVARRVMAALHERHAAFPIDLET